MTRRAPKHASGTPAAAFGAQSFHGGLCDHPFAEKPCNAAFFETHGVVDHVVRCARERGHGGVHVSADGVDYSRLSEAQRDGRACLRCGRDDGPMVPVGRVDDVQVFIHVPCSECSAAASATVAQSAAGAFDSVPNAPGYRPIRTGHLFERAIDLVAWMAARSTLELIADNVSEDAAEPTR